MSNQASKQYNKSMKLDNTMLMYGIYNAETLEKLINTVHEIHNVTSSHKNYLQGNTTPHSLGCYTWMPWEYSNMQLIHYYFLGLYRISTFPCTKNWSTNCVSMSQLSECLQNGICLTLY